MKKLLLAGCAVAMAAGAEVRTYTGIVSDSMCARNHQAMGITPDEKCVIECLKHGSSVKLVLLSGDKMYKLSDQETPKKFAAKKVRVTGELFPKTGVLRVDKIEAAN